MMSSSIQDDWSQLSDHALIEVAKKQRKGKIVDAVIVGFLVGVAMYSVYNHGFGLLTFLPLIYIPIAGRNQKRRLELEKILLKRNLK
ncbi:MAG: hypothetical protein Salg2KO_03880 [Salibacteraceae bacterium]